MEKIRIMNSLDEAVIQFNELVNNLNKDEFEMNVNGRWSAGQDLVHLIKYYVLLILGLQYQNLF